MNVTWITVRYLIQPCLQDEVMADLLCPIAPTMPPHNYQAALDRMRDGVYFLDTGGHVLFANRQTQAIEAAARLIYRHNGLLVAVRRADDRLLQSTLASALQAGPSGSTQMLRLHGRGGQLAGVATLCPAAAAATTAGDATGPIVAMMVFVKALNMPRPSASQELQQALGLTGAERKLAALLMRGLSLEHAAARLGVSKNTVRSQLRGLFDRTGARRQAELVSLLFQLA
jgi:DNA-binding CsgD family transcriptional regulator